MKPNWIDTEPGLRAVFREIGRLRRRSRFRWLLTLTLAIVFTGLLVARESRKQRKYPAKIVMAVTENYVDEDVAPNTTGQFKDYIESAVFTDARLLDIIKKHKLSSFADSVPELALESFREDTEVEVYRNLFLVYAQGRGDQRSARVAISFWAADPEKALVVAREMGQLVIHHEAEVRRGQIEVAKIMNESSVEGAQADVARLEEEIAVDQYRYNQTGDAGTFYRINNLRRSLKRATLILNEAEKQKAGLDLLGAHEASLGGLSFDIADWGQAETPIPKIYRVSVIGLIAFLLLWPLVGLAVGAFDPRVYSAEDVERLGLRALGRVRSARLPTHLGV